MSPSHQPHMSFPSSSYSINSHSLSHQTLSSQYGKNAKIATNNNKGASSPSHYALQILTLNHSLCKEMFDDYRLKMLQLNPQNPSHQQFLLQSQNQYLICLLNFKGEKMKWFMRDFENSVAHQKVSHEFNRVQKEFGDVYWAGFQALVQDIVSKWEKQRNFTTTSTHTSPPTQQDHVTNYGETLDSSLLSNSRSYRHCCDDDLSKYAHCLLKSGKTGDSCEPLKTGYRVCRQVAASLDNGALEKCVRESFVDWYRAQNPAKAYGQPEDRIYSQMDPDTMKVVRLNCVDLFLHGTEQQIETEAVLQGRLTFMEEEAKIDF